MCATDCSESLSDTFRLRLAALGHPGRDMYHVVAHYMASIMVSNGHVNATRCAMMLLIPDAAYSACTFFHFAKYKVLCYNNMPTRCHAYHIPSLARIELRMGEISEVTELEGSTWCPDSIHTR